MYRIIGADGGQYGPVSLAQVKQWIAEGRIDARTRFQAEGSLEWRPAGEIPEIQVFFSSPPLVSASSALGGSLEPPVFFDSALTPASAPRTGLAITSFVFGILSFLCLGLFAGLPAIILGHIAHGRARRMPTQYGGAGFAVGGFALGYASIVMTIIAASLILPALATMKSKSQSSVCSSNMRQIFIAFQGWASDHNDQFPFNVSTNSDGSMEFAAPDPEGFDSNPAAHLRVLDGMVPSLKALVCPADHTKRPAQDMESLGEENLSYQLRVGPEISPDHPEEVLLYCPIHRQELRCDGSIEQRRRGFKKVRLPQHPGRQE